MPAYSLQGKHSIANLLELFPDLIGDLVRLPIRRIDLQCERFLMMHGAAFGGSSILPGGVDGIRRSVLLALTNDFDRSDKTEVSLAWLETMDAGADLLEVGRVRERHRHDDDASKQTEDAERDDRQSTPEAEVLKIGDVSPEKTRSALQSDSDDLRIV